MKVLLIGKTEVDLFPFQGDSRHVMPGKAEYSDFEERVQKDAKRRDKFTMYQLGQELIEFAGRLCYEAFNLPNPSTAKNGPYVRNLIAQGHESVLEHVNVTFYVEGVSRNLTHELIRHRHLSFSELSQRYVNMEEANIVIPPAFGGPRNEPLPRAYKDKYRNAVSQLLKDKKIDRQTRKQAREAARYGLPSGVETKFVVTGNLRAWRDVLKKRHSVHADAEMQAFAAAVLKVLNQQYPDVFADVEYDRG